MASISCSQRRDVYKRQELVAPGTPIMSLVVMDDAHVVLNIREDLMPQFKMGEMCIRDRPYLPTKANKERRPETSTIRKAVRRAGI